MSEGGLTTVASGAPPGLVRGPVGPAILTIDQVSVRFGGLAALDDVSLHASTGEVLGIIGPNGAGKTTLFNVVCGFVRPDAGLISLDGRELRRIRPDQLTRLGISRTLQGVGLWPSLTVVENVMASLHREAKGDLASALLGLPRSSRDERRLRERAIESLDRLGIAGHAARYPGSLPYPVQKKVSIARALVTKPRLLLLDEPASGLSDADIEALGALVRELGRELAVLLVEHHMDLVMAVCDRIVVLDFGKVIASGSPAEIQRNPLVTSAYLGEAAPEEQDGLGASSAAADLSEAVDPGEASR